jgi:hypothetical protein
MFFDMFYKLIMLQDRYNGQTLENYPLYIEVLKFSRADKSQYQKQDDAEYQANVANAEDEEGKEEEIVPYDPPKLKPDGLNWE